MCSVAHVANQIFDFLFVFDFFRFEFMVVRSFVFLDTNKRLVGGPTDETEPGLDLLQHIVVVIAEVFVPDNHEMGGLFREFCFEIREFLSPHFQDVSVPFPGEPRPVFHDFLPFFFDGNVVHAVPFVGHECAQRGFVDGRNMVRSPEKTVDPTDAFTDNAERDLVWILWFMAEKMFLAFVVTQLEVLVDGMGEEMGSTTTFS